MVDSPLVAKGTITNKACMRSTIYRETAHEGNLLAHCTDRVRAEWCGSSSQPRASCSAAAERVLHTLRGLTSQRLLNSLCSIRSSSLVSLLTIVAWRGVLSRMDSPNAVPIPRVQIVTASCMQTHWFNQCINVREPMDFSERLTWAELSPPTQDWWLNGFAL